MPVTLKDVAEACGVNVSTVSRSLNNRYGIDAKTRTRILEIAGKLNYQRNRMASGLATGKSNTFGLIISDVRNPYFAEFARAVESAAFDAGYDLILCNCANDVEKQMHYFRSLTGKMVDGVMFSIVGAFSKESQNEILESGVPTLLLSRPPGKSLFSTLTGDNAKGGAVAGEYLMRLGHSRIGHLTGARHHGNLAARAKGFSKALKRGGIEPVILRGNPTYHGGFEMTLRLIEEAPDLTAIFAANDTIAFGALQALAQIGKRVPDDISLIGFDNIEISSIVRPPLTTLNVPITEKGVVAVEMLLQLAQNGKGTQVVSEHRVLNAELIERESCRAFKRQPK